MRPVGAVVRDYVAISKPRIILLLLIVGWAAMFVALGTVPAWQPFLAVTVAGIASTAASGALNHVLEKDRDRKMGRTADRPVASGRVTRTAATAYALILTAAAFLALWLPGYHLAAWLTLGAVGFYVVVYTVVLKPTTAQNIVIGGFAGSFPALIGTAAAIGTLGWSAWLLAAIVFFWTPPHFWALALLYKEDYAAADYPMMPSVRGEESTKNQMAFYAVLTVLATLGLFALGFAGYLFLAAALYFGVRFVLGAVRLRGDVERTQYRRYFLFTIQYLGLVLVVLIADVVLVSLVPAARPF